MKKAFAVVLGVVMMCFSGCVNQNKAGEKLGKEVLRCFDEGDYESLKTLFCEKVADKHNLDEEIAKAMELYDGESISYDISRIGGGETVIDGAIIKQDIVPVIRDIETTVDKKYKIAIHSYAVYEKSPESVGITYISIYGEDNAEYTIGEVIE